MKSTSILIATGLSLATLFVTASVFAQGPQTGERPPAPESTAAPKPASSEPPRAPGDPPLAQTGFQVAFRSGAALPAGSISDADGNGLSDQFGWQVPLLVEVGAKPLPWLFLGAYGGAGFGGVSESLDKACNDASISCSSRSVRFGVEALVYVLPSARVNPWFGYGIGYESTTLFGDADQGLPTQTVSGLELGHFMAGADLRLNRYLGVGPYVDFAVGRYGSFHSDATAKADAVDKGIDKQAFHEWITLGARLVAFP